MATIRPLRALRPPADKAARIAAVPYDVVDTAEARSLAADNPLSFLHVSRAEIDLPENSDPYSDAVYKKAHENFEMLTSQAPMLLEESASLYIYRLSMGDHTQTGIAGCCSLDEYDNDVVRKHERTRQDKEDDRTRHILTLRAQTGPVFLTYRGAAEIDALVEQALAATPLYSFSAGDGVEHSVWRLDLATTEQLVSAFGSIPLFYIADGHHRAASAARARDRLRSENAGRDNNAARTGGGFEYDFFLGVLFPSDQVQILSYNRVIKDLNAKSPEQFLRALSDRFKIGETPSTAPARKGNIHMYLDHRWHKLELPEGTTMPIDPVAALDVSVLQDRVLSPLLGIEDVRTDKRIGFVGGIRGTSALEKIVDEGQAAVAFSLYPVTVDELMMVSDANKIMPPKSTWFEPKLRDGLLIHLI